MEGCQSGRMGWTANPLCVLRCTEGSNPSPSADKSNTSKYLFTWNGNFLDFM